jgi:two-component system sensor histidine kinase RegB
MSEAPSHAAAWLPWLVRLRWAAVAGQLLTVAIARAGFGLAVPLGWLLAIVAFTAASNAVVAWLAPRSQGRAAQAIAAAVLALDVVLFTTLLGLAGGPANPFSVLYLVHVALAALLFGFGWSIAIAALCAACYAALFAVHVPVSWDGGGHHAHGEGQIALHLQGMWAATAIAAGILSYFVARTADALRQRDERLRELERGAARDEKLVALSALAAGAAHELGSPLATIAVAASELDRAARQIPGAEPLSADALLIRSEAARCREILARMRGEAGADVGETLDATDLSGVLAAVEERLDPRERARLRVRCAAPALPLRAPRAALAQALVHLIRNGLAAAPEGEVVSLEAAPDGEAVRFEVRDGGAGMTRAALSRAGEPFFSTREPGEGMGLGLFLSRAIAERLGGGLRLESAPGCGTSAVLRVRRDPGAARASA